CPGRQRGRPGPQAPPLLPAARPWRPRSAQAPGAGTTRRPAWWGLATALVLAAADLGVSAWLSASPAALLLPRDPGCRWCMTIRVVALASRVLRLGIRGRRPFPCYVTWVTLFLAGRSLADSNGRLRSCTDTAGRRRHADGVCI